MAPRPHGPADGPRRLYLLRHAKSSWDDPFLSDSERPLAPRGEQAAHRLRRHFREIGLAPDLVLCSPARRTRDTWALVCDGLDDDPELRFERGVYGASLAALLDLIREIPDTVDAALLIGHNPGLEDVVRRIDAHALPSGLPTGGFVSIDVAGAWADFEPRSASVASVVRPRELPA